jgi:hypothetical protein
MRIGMQHDLVSIDIRGLIDQFRTVFPQTAFLFEADYSGQMCTDLVSGAQDVAVLYSPKTQQDLYFEMVGEVSYVMVSTHAQTMAQVDKASYILANYAPAFMQTHAVLLPDLMQAWLSIGQNAAMVDLLTSLSGTAYVRQDSAHQLVASGTCFVVKGAPIITQPIFAGLNMRNRHRPAYRKMFGILRAQFNMTNREKRTRSL